MKITLRRAAHTLSDVKQHNVLLIENDALTVTVPADHPYYFREIQKAGRLSDQMGLSAVSLSGDWNQEEQWAFYQGYARAFHPGHIEFAKLPQKEWAQLQEWVKLSEWVKHWVNAGPSQCTPLKLVHAAEQLIREYAEGRATLKIETLTGEDLNHQGFVGCYNVGRGSQNPPVMMSIKVYPKHTKDPTIAASLIGKGITFDSGGYVIKPRDSIGTMKLDMAGAATLTASLALALHEGLSKPVELILCCAENLVSDHAYLPGDILHFKNGVRVEIINTDAEGRLVLADGFIKSAEHTPPLLIDAATLTGAAIVAVGTDYCALFSQDDDLRNRALAEAKKNHELLWPLPLETWHQNAVPSLVADTANAYNGASASPANASIAAGFLSRFVAPKQKWLHYDLSNAYLEKGNALFAGGATATMLRSIASTLLTEI